MRVVLDTNVLVRATKPNVGSAFEILHLLTANIGKADVLCTGDHDLFTDAVQAYALGHGFLISREVELLAKLRL